MTAQPGSKQFLAPPFCQGWVRWWQDMFALHAQVTAAQWRYAAATLETFTPWLEPCVLIVEELVEQMLAAAEHTSGQDPSPAHPSS